MECREKTLRNKRYNAYSVVTTHGKRPRVDFAFARQPWAIKSTTLTALRSCNIYNGGCIHLDIGITLIVLHRERIHHGEFHPLEYWHNTYGVAYYYNYNGKWINERY